MPITTSRARLDDRSGQLPAADIGMTPASTFNPLTPAFDDRHPQGLALEGIH